MHDARAFYSSQVLQDGRVFVAGGEYGAAGTQFVSSGARAEILIRSANAWTQINPPSSLLNYSNPAGVSVNNDLQAFYDSISMLLPDGTVLVAPVDPANYRGTLIYNPFSNTWTNGPLLVANLQGIGCQAEASWVKLADDSILTIDPAANNIVGTNTERYIPSLGQWIVDTSVPFAIQIRTPLFWVKWAPPFSWSEWQRLLFWRQWTYRLLHARRWHQQGFLDRRAGHSRRTRRVGRPGGHDGKRKNPLRIRRRRQSPH